MGVVDASYLLDDPLSAVDAHVGRSLFRNCIRGILRGKCVVLVTHALEYLPACHNVVVMNKGAIEDQGDYAHVSAKQDGVLGGLLKAQAEARSQDVQSPLSPIGLDDGDVNGGNGSEKGNDNGSEKGNGNDCEKGNDNGSEKGNGNGSEKGIDKRNNTSNNNNNANATITSNTTTTDNKKGELTTTETRVTGEVKRSVYNLYFTAAGGLGIVAVVMFLYLLAQVVRAINNWWLTYWTNNETLHSSIWFVGIYTALGIATVIMSGVSPFSLFWTGLHASRKLHDGLLQGIMRSPMSFFDQTPLGRITNRISKDIYTVDKTLPGVFDSFLGCLFSVLATIIVILIAMPLFIVILIPLTAYYLYEQRFYVHSSREIKRLDSISRSPIYANFGETLDGTAVIRAYEAQKRFIEKNNELLDVNQRAYFIISSANCWLGIRLEFAGTVIIGAAMLLSVIGKNPTNFAFTSMAALAISYSLDTTQSLNWLVRMATDMETQIVAVERIEEYTNLPSEAPAHIPGSVPPANWPSRGEINMEDLTMRYRPELEPVLKHISLHIRPGEKVGVVGRTGAGKSSLVLCLMRIVELETGKIVIDGVNIRDIGLEDLRSSIAIIPQEPLLFSGTIRSNLDPFHQYSDEAIWSALEQASMKDVIAESGAGLDTPVEEHGNNYSVGQRQLLCIARALLRKSKVILMDEATASIDSETDMKIQSTIRTQFTESTVITIAHRIHTIIDSDRVLVLDLGEVKEYDQPGVLLENPKSLFSQLVEKSKELENWSVCCIG